MVRHSVYVGLGSNQASPLVQIRQALAALGEIPNTLLVRHSSLYASEPMGPQDQPDYVNAVAMLDTSLTPIALLDELQSIENAQGRVRKNQRWGPRTLDLDMLLYGHQEIDLPRLTVPHYGMKERAFVLYPLAEISPDLVLPGGIPLKSVLQNCAKCGLEIVQSNDNGQ